MGKIAPIAARQQLDVRRGAGDGGGVEFNAPGAVAVDPVGNVYVADTGNNAIRKIDTQGNVTTVAGNGSLGYADGPGGVAEFNKPVGLALSPAGTLFVADQNNNRIRLVQ